MILAIGNINLDWICTLPRLPEPDEKLNIQQLDIHPGGAASNFAVSLARLGSDAALFGHVGNDAEGTEALRSLQEEKVDTSRVIIDDTLSTGFVIILVGGDGQTMKLRFRGANTKLSPKDITPKLLENIEIAHAASVSIPIAKKLATISAKVGTRSSIDVGEELITQSLEEVRAMICSFSIVFMNKLVFERIFNEEPTPQKVQQELGGNLEVLNVTLGATGAITATANTTFQIPAFKVKAVDTTGAGDAYGAGFIHFFNEHYSIEKTAERATAAAAMQITQPGARAGLPTTHEIEEFIKTHKQTTD